LVIGSCLVAAGSAVVASSYLPWVSSPNGCLWPGHLVDDGRAAAVIGVALAAVGLGVVAFRAAQRWLSTIALILSLILGVIARIDTKHIATFCSDSASTVRSGLYLLAVAACVGFLASLAGVLTRSGESRDWTSLANDGGSRSPQVRSLV
jgi:hypothetical protein